MCRRSRAGLARGGVHGSDPPVWIALSPGQRDINLAAIRGNRDRIRPTAEWLIAVRPMLVATVRLGPGGEALAQPRRARLLAFEGRSFVGVAREVEELIRAGAQIVDVLPLALADAELELVLRDVKIRARRMRGIEQAASLPVGRRRQPGELGDCRREIHVAADHRRVRLHPIAPRPPDHERHVDVFLVQRAPLRVDRHPQQPPVEPVAHPIPPPVRPAEDAIRRRPRPATPAGPPPCQAW